MIEVVRTSGLGMRMRQRWCFDIAAERPHGEVQLYVTYYAEESRRYRARTWVPTIGATYHHQPSHERQSWMKPQNVPLPDDVKAEALADLRITFHVGYPGREPHGAR